LLVIGNQLWGASDAGQITVSNLETGYNIPFPESIVYSTTLWNKNVCLASLDFTIYVWEMKVWSPSIHHLYPLAIKKQILAIMILALKFPNSLTPLHPEVSFHRLPNDILTLIQCLAQQ